MLKIMGVMYKTKSEKMPFAGRIGDLPVKLIANSKKTEPKHPDFLLMVDWVEDEYSRKKREEYLASKGQSGTGAPPAFDKNEELDW